MKMNENKTNLYTQQQSRQPLLDRKLQRKEGTVGTILLRSLIFILFYFVSFSTHPTHNKQIQQQQHNNYSLQIGHEILRLLISNEFYRNR